MTKTTNHSAAPLAAAHAIIDAMDAAERRAERSRWNAHVFRSWSDAEDYDVRFWDAIPVDERMRAVWDLSLELHRIAHPDQPHEPRLSRLIAVVTRGPLTYVS